MADSDVPPDETDLLIKEIMEAEAAIASIPVKRFSASSSDDDEADVNVPERVSHPQALSRGGTPCFLFLFRGGGGSERPPWGT